MPLIKGVPDWGVYAGGGLVLGGGYLLYKKRKAKTTPAATTAPVSTYGAGGESGQQSSVVPYYLTGGQGQAPYGGAPGGGIGTSNVLPTPAGTPGSTNVGTGGGDLGVIPPILPNVNTTTNIPQPSIAGPTPTPTAPAPAPSQTVANLPPDLLQRIQANGEQIIGNLIDPLTGGTWWFSNKGGVFAVNGARFLGSIPSVNATYPGQVVVQAIPLGTGYRIVDTAGHTYNFGG